MALLEGQGRGGDRPVAVVSPAAPLGLSLACSGVTRQSFLAFDSGSLWISPTLLDLP